MLEDQTKNRLRIYVDGLDIVAQRGELIMLVKRCQSAKQANRLCEGVRLILNTGSGPSIAPRM